MKFIKILLVVGVLLLSAYPASAVEYGGIGGRPANPQADNPRTESIFIYTLNPGESKTDGIRVINNTADKKTLLVYAVDSVTSTDGAFACAQAVDPKLDLGAWITLDKSELTLESMTNEVVPFKLLMPASASVGEHNACLIVQEKKEAAQGSGVQLSFRTGLRVVTLVPGEVQRELAIVGYKVTAKNKDVFFLSPRVKNLGNVSIDAEVKVKTEYFFGRILQNSGGQYPILRGQTSEWNFELPKPFWGGWYKSSFSVEYDKSIQAQVGKNSGQALSVLPGPTVWFFVMPALTALITELAVILILLLLIFLLVRKFKRRK